MTTHLPPLVGLLGRKRTGKDTFASVLVDEFDFVRIGFADPLRTAALALDPLVGRPAYAGNLAPTHDVRLGEVVEALGWEAAKDLVPEVRVILQRLGTDAIRTLDPTFWVRAAMREVDLRREALGQAVVVTDVRFPNEAEAIRQRGGTLLRLVRPTRSDAPALDVEHASESALDDFDDDAIVVNDCTLDEFRDVARYFAANVL